MTGQTDCRPDENNRRYAASFRLAIIHTNTYDRYLPVVSGIFTDLYSMLDAVPPIHAESSHVATDKDSSK